MKKYTSTVARPGKSVATASLDEMYDHFKVNAIGSLVLYQATKPLLDKSSNAKLVFISTAAASIGIQAAFPFNNTPYSVSKAALNTIGARLAFEEKNKIVVLMLHPGLVYTDMVKNFDAGPEAQAMFAEMGLKPISPQESADNILKIVTSAKHEDTGNFIDTGNGNILPW
jgi:norsolorinic acid ketoreductase